MKRLNIFITEKLKLTRNNKIQEYNYHPKSNKELRKLVNKLIEERGNDADLNDIDTSEITNMSLLFEHSQFNGDISQWDVSNVKDMQYMFYGSEFNGDISEWNVSNVKNMNCMFDTSKFNGDISKWDVSNVIDMNYMFSFCPLEKNPPAWYKK